eukprot:839298-Amphidinium_carterae.1
MGQYQRQTRPTNLPISWQGLRLDGQWCLLCAITIAHVEGIRSGHSQEDSGKPRSRPSGTQDV